MVEAGCWPMPDGSRYLFGAAKTQAAGQEGIQEQDTRALELAAGSRWEGGTGEEVSGGQRLGLGSSRRTGLDVVFASGVLALRSGAEGDGADVARLGLGVVLAWPGLLTAQDHDESRQTRTPASGSERLPTTATDKLFT